MTQQPQAKYRHDYRAPEYLISDIDLTFDLDAAKTVVTAESKVSRHAAASDVPLRLDGEDLTLIALQVNGQPWSDYKEENNQLVIGGLPEHFTLTIVNEISPAANTALEGLYQSGEALCTQCEAEGFRHITWYLDRPDVLARFTTKIIADKAKYPFLLSNGNRMAEGELENGRHWVQWQDPFPKPCYLFALVAGDFDVLRDTFTTRSGREVALELYVDRGNLDRAPWAMTSLKNSMKWDEERFGLEYDLDIYMIVAVDFFNMGAMENKGLNVFNSFTEEVLQQAGLVSATASFELRLSQIRDMIKPLDTELIIYGRIPLMVSDQCIIRHSAGRCNCQTPGQMADRMGSVFPVVKEFGCRNVIYNAHKLYLADKAEDVYAAGAWGLRMMFTTEGMRECVEVAKGYMGLSDYKPNVLTRGLYYRGVD